MRKSKHTMIKSRILAIVFLFLNAVCIASPVLKSTGTDCKQLISLPFGHDANSSEAEENQLTNISFINQHSQVSATSKKQTINDDFKVNIPVLRFQKHSNSSITVSDFLPKPGYYKFLFLYTLF